MAMVLSLAAITRVIRPEFRNPMHGFDENNATYPMIFHSNTAYSNGPDMPGGVSWTGNYGLYKSGHQLRNNINFGVLGSVAGDAQFNSWNLSVTVSSADFVTMNDSAIRGPRNADGSLPASDFLNLIAGSDLIDKGVNVGLAYTGTKPDLGAYEYKAAPVPAPAPSPAPNPAPAPVPPSSGTSLLLNGGFEEQDKYWQKWGNDVTDTSNIHSGRYSLKIGTGEGGRGQVVGAIVAGATYTLTGNGKVPNLKNEGCAIGMDFLNALEKKISSTAPALAVSGGWSTSAITVKAKAPAKTKLVRVWIWKNAGSSNCYIDNLALKKN